MSTAAGAGLLRRAPIVVAGVVLAHTIGYAGVYHDGAERDSHLAATGHGYWPLAVAAAVVAALAAAGLAARRGARPVRPVRPAGSLPAAVGRLTAVQMAIFAAVEILERVAAGAPPAAEWRRPEILVGLALQAVTALVVLSVMRAVEALTADVLDAERRRRPRRRGTGLVVRSAPRTGRPGPPGGRTPSRPRAPPSPACA